jgi:hypothetical protein
MQLPYVLLQAVWTDRSGMLAKTLILGKQKSGYQPYRVKLVKKIVPTVGEQLIQLVCGWPITITKHISLYAPLPRQQRLSLKLQKQQGLKRLAQTRWLALPKT